MKKYDGIKKIISGGQTGADIAGLQVAKQIGLATGGYAPSGYWTENGTNYDLLELYGLEEFGDNYKQRTERNVLESDGTLLFVDRTSPGSVQTLNFCRKHRKPHLIATTAEEIKKWLYDNRIIVLNVAGNRESVSPGINERTIKMLLSCITGQ